MKNLPNACVRVLILLLGSTVLVSPAICQEKQGPLRLAVAGLRHGHAPFIFNRPGKTDVKVVGIFEPDAELAKAYAKKYKLGRDLFFKSLNSKIITRNKPI